MENIQAHVPRLHCVASGVRTFLFAIQGASTHQGSFVPAHLQSYLEEYTFRFNRRTSGSRGLVFRRLMEQAMVTGPVTGNDVTFGYNWGENQAGGAN